MGITHDNFVDVAESGQFTVIGTFTGAKKKVAIRCDKCCVTFSWRADALLNGNRCPKCRSNNKIISDICDILTVDVSTPLHPNSHMMISRVDYDVVKRLGAGKIYAVEQGGRGHIYAKSHIKKSNVFVHRLILPNSEVVDHIDGNGLNNLRSNIRACTYSQNNMNAKVRSHNVTGVKGVGIEGKTGRYYARITSNGIKKHLGMFDTIEEASKVYQEAADDLHGEFSYANRNKGESK